MTKGLATGSFNLGLGFALDGKFPELGTIASALALGFFAYGVSLVLFIYALRHLGWLHALRLRHDDCPPGNRHRGADPIPMRRFHMFHDP